MLHSTDIQRHSLNKSDSTSTQPRVLNNSYRKNRIIFKETSNSPIEKWELIYDDSSVVLTVFDNSDFMGNNQICGSLCTLMVGMIQPDSEDGKICAKFPIPMDTDMKGIPFSEVDTVEAGHDVFGIADGIHSHDERMRSDLAHEEYPHFHLRLKTSDPKKCIKTLLEFMNEFQNKFLDPKHREVFYRFCLNVASSSENCNPAKPFFAAENPPFKFKYSIQECIESFSCSMELQHQAQAKMFLKCLEGVKKISSLDPELTDKIMRSYEPYHRSASSYREEASRTSSIVPSFDRFSLLGSSSSSLQRASHLQQREEKKEKPLTPLWNKAYRWIYLAGVPTIAIASVIWAYYYYTGSSNIPAPGPH